MSNAFRFVYLLVFMIIDSLSHYTWSETTKLLIKVDYDFVQVEVSPRQQTHSVHIYNTYTLYPGGKYATHAINGNYNQSSQWSLGMPTSGNTISNIPVVSRTRIIKDGILSVIFSDTWKRVTTIRTNGKDSCVASMSCTLNSGQKYFLNRRLSNNEIMYDSDEHAENINCSIEAESN